MFKIKIFLNLNNDNFLISERINFILKRDIDADHSQINKMIFIYFK
jgi:hypothetical protein